MSNQSITWNDAHYTRSAPEETPAHWRYFEDQPDPFNPGNYLSAFVQTAGGDQYGEVRIARVNGEPAPQIIRTTPKVSYPYGRDGGWLLPGPEEVEQVRGYRKYDGTNICQYAYFDRQGRMFVTFKLRRHLFVSENLLNQSQGGMCIFGVLRVGVGVAQQGVGP